ncbi:MAG: riboflavin synthase [Bacteroidia bacterium]|jgi:riboflavin synthase
MFTGIIEACGKITAIQKEGRNVHFTVSSPIANQLKIDQSIAHNGVCLTVVACDDSSHTVTAIDETLSKSNLGSWDLQTTVNLERCMQMNGRLDGHLVQGHVDTTAKLINKEEANGSWIFTFQYANNPSFVTVEKGSITINGISLTVFNSERNQFSVAIIPYTFENTNFHELNENDKVNLEFDIIGKYVARLMQDKR